MKTKRLSPQLLPLLLTTIALATAWRGTAATITWTNTVSGVWSLAANWNPNQAPGASDTAVITNSAVTVTLTGPASVGGIILGADASSGGVTTLLIKP